jgi:hypothetical protein
MTPSLKFGSLSGISLFKDKGRTKARTYCTNQNVALCPTHKLTTCEMATMKMYMSAMLLAM